MKPKFSFVTNATQADGLRLKYFLPSVLRSFGDVVEEVLVVVDSKPEEGRIKRLHKGLGDIESLDHIKSQFRDTIVRFIDLDYTFQPQTSQKWFNTTDVNRCQNGTPIFAFLYGIEQCSQDNIIRSDCDILFYDHGFIEQLSRQSEQYDLVQLPFLSDGEHAFSTRCFFINRKRIESKLPLHPLKLDFIRRVHRQMYGRSQYMALEQMLEEEIVHQNIKAQHLNTELGYTMHIPSRKDFIGLEKVMDKFHNGEVPEKQKGLRHDYHPSAWLVK